MYKNAPPQKKTQRRPPAKPPKHLPQQPRDDLKKDKKTTGPAEPTADSKDGDGDLFAETVPVTLQQLMLNVFKYALLYSNGLGGISTGGSREVTALSMENAGTAEAEAETADTAETESTAATTTTTEPETTATAEAEPAEGTLNTKSLIQTIKSHLYNRDFDSAFTDADDDLLRAYALRWSATRALGGRSHPAPLARFTGTSGQLEQQGEENEKEDTDFQVRFRRADILSIPDEELKSLLYFNDDNTLSLDSLSLDPTTTTKKETPTIITLMFTLNELFSTSMAKATSLLLRITDLVQAGSLLLVVDSPGSYSTLRLARQSSGDGSGEKEGAPERRYPMKFLLDHALLSVAGGKWERVYSRDSRWWRREASRLSYVVGEGAGLEDMRFQVHLYRRV
ncbi:hypothetical protein P168DRAFT_301521 [Aspergillus campestris IBT 28561]|uniref:Uncharacterized protein n=1 Tax=Aspergillus campestris (strain IBT 28561) TaxID=1392248 RepID=A0A2I1DGB1_ASPC2|nr:uncharacterized protein P168DRAFT_301521 [Aspergillus campestris IBT 28561]PKY08909.1 hypothetical protein P168DRAFT_301521 [Aspergillus campestris IBT 28561]